MVNQTSGNDHGPWQSVIREILPRYLCGAFSVTGIRSGKGMANRNAIVETDRGTFFLKRRSPRNGESRIVLLLQEAGYVRTIPTAER